jgi:hypothetical protein
VIVDENEISIEFRDDAAVQDPDDRRLLREAMAAEYRLRAHETDATRENHRRAREDMISRRSAGTESAGEPSDPRAQAEALNRIRAGLDVVRRETGRLEPAFDVSVHAGLTTISAPYDYDVHWQAPGTRFPDQSIGDPPGGLMQIQGSSGSGDDRVDAVAGVGFVLRSDVLGIVQVRPYITYEWRYVNLASGAFSSAESEGGVELSAWRDGDGALVSAEGVRRSRLFRDRVSPGEFHQNAGDGAVSSSDIQIELTAEPGRSYFVNAGVWVKCDHSAGVTVAPTSSGFGFLSAHLRFVVFQRFT